MTVYLQPSAARWWLETTMEFRRSSRNVLHPIDHELAVRVRFLGTALVGVAQAVYCFAIWVFMSVASVLTLGYFDSLERVTKRAQSLCGAGLIVVAACVASLFDTMAAEVITNAIVNYGDRCFKALCATFEDAFETEAEEIRDIREKRAHARQLAIRPEFFAATMKDLHWERVRKRREYERDYPTDSAAKYDALVASQAEMYDILRRQYCQLEETPYTQGEVDTYYVKRAQELADDAQEELYHYPKQLLVNRLKAWEGKGWDREGFQEQCIKLFPKHRLERDIADLIEHVKGAKKKETAFRRFVQDINALVRKEKKQIYNTEKPNIIKQLWWNVGAWLNSRA